MKAYELLYIIDKDVNEELRKKLIEKINKTLESAQAEIKVDEWGMKNLAHPINYKSEGYYVLVSFTSLPTVIAKITNELNITEKIVRYNISTAVKPVKANLKTKKVKAAKPIKSEIKE